MTNTKKMTKADYFKQISANYPLTPDEQAFIEHELALLSKSRSDRKPTARQNENSAIAEAILDFMVVGEKYTITQLLKGVPGLPEDMTNQRMTAIVRQMIGETIERIPEGNKTYFRIIAR